MLIPGIVLSTTFSGEGQDVGGTTGDVQQTLSIHGSRGNEGRRTMDGLNLGVSEGGTFGGFSPNMGCGPGSHRGHVCGVGGAVGRRCAREPGAARRRQHLLWIVLRSPARTRTFQADNYTDRLQQARRGPEPGAVKTNYDINPAFGGPLVRDRLWFFTAARWYRVDNYVTGAVRNANAGNAALVDVRARPELPRLARIAVAQYQRPA